jgi:hypothetical protein
MDALIKIVALNIEYSKTKIKLQIKDMKFFHK